MQVVDLSADEALVLFELLAREITDLKEKRIAGVIEHPAEFWVLCSVLGSLEKSLAEPFRADYRQLLAAAQERILDVSDPDRTYVVGEV